jgi:hypothetical protein
MLVGPNPKEDRPVFPTPWEIWPSGEIVDANGNRILRVDSVLGSIQEDAEIQALIVNLVNGKPVRVKAETPDPEALTGVYRYFVETFPTLEPTYYRIDFETGEVESRLYRTSTWHPDDFSQDFVIAHYIEINESEVPNP